MVGGEGIWVGIFLLNMEGTWVVGIGHFGLISGWMIKEAFQVGRFRYQRQGLAREGCWVLLTWLAETLQILMTDRDNEIAIPNYQVNSDPVNVNRIDDEIAVNLTSNHRIQRFYYLNISKASLSLFFLSPSSTPLLSLR